MVVVSHLSVLSFSTDILDSACTNNDGVELLARWMSVHLNDRKAAYHVPHRRATDICHLQSFIFPLPASPKHIPLHSRTHIHTLFFSRRVPTSKASLPLFCLITQTVCRSTPPSSAARGTEQDEESEKGKGRQRG